MKNKLRLLALFLSVGVLFLFTNCQKDDEVTTTTQSSNPTTGIKVSTILFDEFKRDTKAYEEFLNISGSNFAKRMVVDSDNGFFYNDSEVILIEYDKNKTYTFEIFAKDDKTDIYENLVIFEDENQVTTSHIFGYNLNSTDLANLSTSKQIINLSEKYYVKSKRKEHNSDLYFVGDDGNCYVRTWYHPETDEYTGDEGVYYILRVECPPSLQLTEDGTGGGGGDSGGGDSGGSSGGNGGGAVNIVVVIPVAPGGAVTDPGGVSGGGNNSGGGSNGGGSAHFPIVITQPYVNLNYLVYRKLIWDINPIYDWLVDNPEFKTELDKFLNASTLPFQDKQDFAKDLLDFAYINENNGELAKQILEFLEEESYSPESLEAAINAIEDIENGDIPENILNMVYPECQNKLVVSGYSVCSESGINNIFQTMFQNSNTHTITYKVSDDLPDNVAGRTDPIGYKLNSSGVNVFYYEVLLDRHILNTATDLYIVKTVIHENFHAILMFFRQSGIITLDENATYQELIDAYADKLVEMGNQPFMPISGNVHHDFMAYFIADIADTLKEYGESKGYILSDEFYEQLSWGGLTHINDSNGQQIINPAFLHLVPNNSDRQEILDVITAERKNEEFNGKIPSYKNGSCN